MRRTTLTHSVSARPGGAGSAARGRGRQPGPVRALPGRRTCCWSTATAQRQATLDEVRGLGVDMIKVQVNWSVGGAGRPAQAERLRRHRPVAVPGLGALRRRACRRSRARPQGDVRPRTARPRLGHARHAPRPRGREPAERPRVRALRRGGRAALPRGRRLDALERAEPPRPSLSAVRERPPGGAAHLPRAWSAPAARGLARGGAERKPILFGELLPIGKSSTGPKRNLKPLRFLRSFFSRGKPLTGLDGFAYHPYTRPGRAVPHRALAGRRHDPLVRANRPGAGLRAGAGAHHGQAPTDLEHRVRLPDEPAGPVLRRGDRAGAVLLVGLRALVLLSEPAHQEHLPVHDGRPGRSTRASGRAACASPTAARRRTSTTTSGCRSWCASSAPGPWRCAVTRDRPAPAPWSRSSSAAAAGRSRTSAARSRSATSAATSWPATGSRTQPQRTFRFTTGGQTSLAVKPVSIFR